jgi:predicted RNA-binding Zn-ribbon protein involved in translation (DUF1610 family)
VADAGLGELQRQLDYKSRWRGRHFVKLDRFDASTQTCSACGHRCEGEAKLGLSDRHWACPSCGEKHDRDENASLNTLRWGLDQLIRRGTPEFTPGESGALAGDSNPSGKRRRGKGLRRNSARGTGNVEASQDLVSRELLHVWTPHEMQAVFLGSGVGMRSGAVMCPASRCGRYMPQARMEMRGRVQINNSRVKAL